MELLIFILIAVAVAVFGYGIIGWLFYIAAVRYWGHIREHIED